MGGFQVGDRIVCVNDNRHAVDSGAIHVGMTGIVRQLSENYWSDGDHAIGVEWDERSEYYMHNLDGSISNECGWYVRPEAIELEDGYTTDFEANTDIDDLL